MRRGARPLLPISSRGLGRSSSLSPSVEAPSARWRIPWCRYLPTSALRERREPARKLEPIVAAHMGGAAPASAINSALASPVTTRATTDFPLAHLVGLRPMGVVVIAPPGLCSGMEG